MPEPTDYERSLRTEIAAMRRVVAALDTLDRPAQLRALRWLLDRYAVAATEEASS